MTRREQLWATFNCGLFALSWSIAAEPLWFSVAILLLSMFWTCRWYALWSTPPKRREVTVYFSEAGGRVPYVIADDDIDVRVRDLQP